jgi:hypothetical protein
MPKAFISENNDTDQNLVSKAEELIYISTDSDVSDDEENCLFDVTPELRRPRWFRPEIFRKKTDLNRRRDIQSNDVLSTYSAVDRKFYKPRWTKLARK